MTDFTDENREYFDDSEETIELETEYAAADELYDEAEADRAWDLFEANSK